MKHNSRNLLALTYNEISALVGAAGIWLSRRLPNCGPYEREPVVKRLQQRIVELLHVPLLTLRIKNHRGNLDTQSSRHIDCAGLRINTDTGQVTPQIGLVGRSLLEFFKHWLLVLFFSAKGLINLQSRRLPSATVVLGIGEADLHREGNDQEFIKYCQGGPIDPLKNARHLVVQSSLIAASSQPMLITYSRRPLLALPYLIAWTLSDFIHFLRLHVSSAKDYLIGTCRFPLLSILAYDYAYLGLISSLNRKQAIENFVITNSLYIQQPLWMTSSPGRTFSVHMVFYSMMGNPFVYKDEPVKGILPAFRYLHTDVFWVWTEGQASFLRELEVPGEVHVSGPVLWRLRKPSSNRECSVTQICVFDVTPVSPADEIQYGIPKGNYYEVRTALEFMKGILAVRERFLKEFGINLQIVLKHKRPFHPIHDSRYVTQINEWEFEKKVIKRASSDADMFSLIQESALAIVMPFSSPAYIAAHLGVTAIYFDPISQLEATFENDPRILFAAGEDHLFNLVCSHILVRPDGHLLPMQAS